MKYNRKPVAGYVVALLVAGMAISCAKDQVLEPAQTTPDAADLQIKAVDDGNYHGEIVPLELAKLVAQKTEFQQLYGGLDSLKTTKGGRMASGTKAIRNAVSLRDNHNQPALHVINYEHGGFVVLSAERSALPVLAFSDEKSFDATKLPDVVTMWVDGTKVNLEQIRTATPAARSARKVGGAAGMKWDNVLAMTGLLNGKSNPNARGPVDPICPRCPPEPNPDPCNQFWLGQQRGPYVKTNWGQSGGNAHIWHWQYNSLTPNGALAGCGPVAMAQLMRFWNYPATYYSNYWHQFITVPWNDMPDNSASYASAILFKDLGDAAKATWGSGPGQETSTQTDNTVQAFRNFGYKHVGLYDSYNSADLTMSLNGVPVLLRGDDKKGSGHIWVCDGFKLINSNCATSSSYYWHMNWGWGDTQNGYYADWSARLNEQTNQGGPGRDVFGAKRKMLVARPSTPL